MTHSIEEGLLPLKVDAKDTLKRSAMASGRFLDPWDIKPEEIFIEDIARGLAHINRYNGQFGDYSVAQHSVFVSRILPASLALPGLLHDAPEYATGDLSHHIKHGPGFIGMCWRQLDTPIQHAVEDRFGLDRGELSEPQIKAADDRIFNMEWEHFVQGKRAPGSLIFEPWGGERAEREFLRAFASYTGAS